MMKKFSEMIRAEQAPIGAALERVIKKLPRAVQNIASYSLLSEGKRLRPILSLLSARLLFPEISAQNTKIYDAAIVLEMFHVASLLHDDVLDNADTRRGQTSVHIKYGIRPCLLAGDALLAAGNRQMAEFAFEMNCPKLIHSISDALLHTSTGEIEEIALVGKILPNMDEYFSVIEGKTAWILRSACEVGALMASVVNIPSNDASDTLGDTAGLGSVLEKKAFCEVFCSVSGDKLGDAKSKGLRDCLDNLSSNSSSVSSINSSTICFDEKIERLATFGLNLGMAFQIVDDALDFTPESATGKPIGGDLRERKCTPPIFMYAQSLDAEKRKEFEAKFAIVPTPVFEANGNVKISAKLGVNAKIDTGAKIDTEAGFTESELAHIIQEIIENKYPEKTKALADSYLEKAEKALSPFSGEYCDLLLQALHYVRARNK